MMVASRAGAEAAALADFPFGGGLLLERGVDDLLEVFGRDVVARVADGGGVIELEGQAQGAVQFGFVAGGHQDHAGHAGGGRPGP